MIKIILAGGVAAAFFCTPAAAHYNGMHRDHAGHGRTNGWGGHGGMWRHGGGFHHWTGGYRTSYRGFRHHGYGRGYGAARFGAAYNYGAAGYGYGAAYAAPQTYSYATGGGYTVPAQSWSPLPRATIAYVPVVSYQAIRAYYTPRVPPYYNTPARFAY